MVSGSVVKRAFRYRFFPSAAQEVELLRTFGCVRLVYNRALEARTAAWFGERRRVNYVQTSALLTEWKKTDGLGFLNEVSSVPLQQSLRHLQTAFAAFWEKRSRYPRFKSRKRGRASAEYTRSAFRWRDGRLTLAKMDGPLDVVWSRPLPEGAEPSTVTVSRDPAGRWHVSILVETTVAHAPPTDRVVGAAAGITSLVVVEDLAVRNMLRNGSLARAISDASWSELRSMLEYKCGWYGRDLVVVDRWFPSSKTCSACGHLLDLLPLRVREWTCPGCGARHDRDVNAARNILAAGQAVTACGAGVRPTRR
ncbi:putative transposase [Saccharothrix ecbatanensis]|uniref:Putative transposase n=1 Tax=Saccharothrix ecbatanensis TaxID=1105145 RepID=A0A7W9HGK6_9PSEU|nr:RNA-guided endonuclease TnpB family protein [Saccharothrix ecbatanensis]MBB5801872.1 putative transposase [Saccharothrix ecbatanensis]